MGFGIASIAAITVISFLAGFVFKTAAPEELHKWIPPICGLVGLILGIVAYYIGMPDFPATDIINAAAIGVVSGLAATGIHQIGHQLFVTKDSTVAEHKVNAADIDEDK